MKSGSLTDLEMRVKCGRGGEELLVLSKTKSFRTAAAAAAIKMSTVLSLVTFPFHLLPQFLTIS